MDLMSFFYEHWKLVAFGIYLLVLKLKNINENRYLSFSDRCNLLNKDKFSENISIPMIARIMVGARKKEFFKIFKTAQYLAKKDNSLITMNHFIMSFHVMTFGDRRKNFIMSDETKKQVAFHESGHAIGHICQQLGWLVYSISIVPREKMLGFVHALPFKESFESTINFYEDQVRINLSGVIAEQIFGLPDGKLIHKDIGYDDLLTRAQVFSDFEKVRVHVMTIWMLQKHPIINLCNKKKLSDEDVIKINKAMHQSIKVYYEQTYDFVIDHQDKVQKLAECLLKKETLYCEQIYQLLDIDRPQCDFEIKEK